MNPIVIYHANCWDGFCAAWLLWKVFPEAEFVPAHYGDAPPDVAGRTVFIVDFSYPRDVLVQLCGQAEHLTVLDHHKTAQAALDGFEADNAEIVFNMNKSGGRLTWEYCCQMHCGKMKERFDIPDAVHGLHPSPWLVNYTEDRDLWRFVLPRSKEVCAALRSHDLDFDVWEALAQCDPMELATEGEAILRYQQTVVDAHVRNAEEKIIAGHCVLCVNATTMFSEIAGELSKDRPFGACYFDRAGGIRQYSLRSTDAGVDVSEVAKRFGGGGHRNAAGFEVKTDSRNLNEFC